MTEPEPPEASPGLDEYNASILPPLTWFHPGWWHNREVSVAYLSSSVRPPVRGWPVMAHVLLTDTDTVTGALYGRYVPDGLEPGTDYIASTWVWIDPAGRFDLVGMVFDGFSSAETGNARLDRPSEWQRIWVRATLPEGQTAANPRLYLIGSTDAMVYSTGWSLQRG